jgi:hypothetical protein
MGQGPNWTLEQKEFLSENWGYHPAPWIAEKLDRSLNAVIIKSVRYKLGAATSAGEAMTANAVAVLMGVDRHTITDYWMPNGLKAQHKAMRGVKQMHMINFHDLLKWIKDNQDKWDSRRVELFALGSESEWLKEKRRRDGQKISKGCIRWTPAEDQRAIVLFRRGLTINQIADRLGRTHAGVEHRIGRLDVWGTGKYIGNIKRVENENLKKKQAVTRLAQLLLFHRNQIAFDGYWQKSMCMNWDDHCTANQTDCDSCTAFIRIREQYCRRCGATFFKRQVTDMCDKCKVDRKKQAQRKWATLNKRAG